MTTLEIKAGKKTLEVTAFEDGDIEIDIEEDRPGWNDGGQGIQCNIILGAGEAQRLLDFLNLSLKPSN